MTLTASKLRQDVYRILDQVIDTGVPVEIERKGVLLKIVAVDKPARLARLKQHAYMLVDSEELVHNDWSGEWKP